MHEVFQLFRGLHTPPGDRKSHRRVSHRSDFCRRVSKVEKLREIYIYGERWESATTTTNQSEDQEAEVAPRRKRRETERAAAGDLRHEKYLFDVCEEDVCDGFVVRSSQREIPTRNKVEAAVRNPMDLWRVDLFKFEYVLSRVVVVKIRVPPLLLLVSVFGEGGGCGGRVGQAPEEEDTLQHIAQGESKGPAGSEGKARRRAASARWNHLISE